MTAPHAACDVSPAPVVADLRAYSPARPAFPVDLYLDANEGASPPVELLETLRALAPEVLRRYPDAKPLETLLAKRFGVEKEQVLVTAGGDDALERACRAVLAPGREMVLPAPTFEMFPRYARLCGAEVARVPWLKNPFPLEATRNAVTPRTAAVVFVSPNNPTGLAASAADLEKLAAAAPQALLIVDLAYAEFADEDLTAVALRLPNAVVVRTFSKAWGLAGLRVGYALGPARVIDWMRAVGAPYAAARPSLALAAARLETGTEEMENFVARVRFERAELEELLRERGAEPWPSQANFVLARFPDAAAAWEGLARRGIRVRLFTEQPELKNCLRITCPGNERDFKRLTAALTTVLHPGGEKPEPLGNLSNDERPQNDETRRRSVL